MGKLKLVNIVEDDEVEVGFQAKEGFDVESEEGVVVL